MSDVSSTLWTQCFSKSQKRPYWFNKKTGESVWEKPDELKTPLKTSVQPNGHSLGHSLGQHSELSLVANHYNKRIEDRKFRQLSDSIHVRNFHNWIKIVILNEASRTLAIEWFEYLKSQGQFGDYYDNTTVDTIYAKQDEIKHLEKNLDLRVLDLACGQGGDLKKWGHLGVSDYFGFDIAAEAVERAQKRYNEGRFKFRATFLAHDLCQPILGVPGLAPESIDIVSMQFAIHYFFGKQRNLETLLSTVRHYLKPGGYFVGTTTDFKYLTEKLKDAGPDSFDFGNRYYSINYSSDTRDAILSDNIEPFGLNYYFSFTDAVKMVPEYAVQPQVLKQYGEKYGLELVELKNFHQYYYDKANSYMPLFQKLVGYKNSSEEWHTSAIYCVFVFRKK